MASEVKLRLAEMRYERRKDNWRYSPTLSTGRAIVEAGAAVYETHSLIAVPLSVRSTPPAKKMTAHVAQSRHGYTSSTSNVSTSRCWRNRVRRQRDRRRYRRGEYSPYVQDYQDYHRATKRRFGSIDHSS